ncbi:hypothetical protein [Streptomyces sp. SM11]|uniref:hypothetical protein n=1 Tax=Streptomyces sp. SM11 TaxID=565557 RepID=UPI000CD4F41C|nr:hypothetical protein [Streptomyces sp. SM11]
MKPRSAEAAAGQQSRLAFRLARRLGRSRALIRSTLTVFVAAVFVMTMFIVLKTLSLSGAQVADRDMGRFDASVGYGSIQLPPGDDTFVPELRERLQQAGITDTLVMLSAFDVQLDTTPARNVTMFEADWSSNPYPRRYDLQSGRWPTGPGEVVVTEPHDVRTAPGKELTVLGDVRLKVVGTANDRNASTTNLLAGPGTWAALDENLVEGFPILATQPLLLWSGAEPKSGITAFSAAIRNWEKEQNRKSESDIAVANTLSLREEGSGEGFWIEKTPAGYTVPALLVPLGAVLLVFGLNDRRFRRTAGSLTSLGISRRTAAAGLTLATLAWSLIAATAGAAAGLGVGAAARLLVSRLRERPAGPIDGLADPALRLLILIVLTSLVAGLALARDDRRHASAPANRDKTGRSTDEAATTKTSRRIRDTRQVLAVLAWCATAVYAVRVDSPAMAMTLTGLVTVAVLLVIPEAFALTLKFIPEKGPRSRLARRQLAADSRRASASLAVLTVLFGASLGFLALLDTLLRTADTQRHPDVLSGQILLADSTSDRFAPTKSVLRAAEATGLLDGHPRLEVTPAYTMDRNNVTRSATRPGSDTIFLTVKSPADAERLLGHSLGRDQLATLTAGGLLIWSDAPGAPEGTSARTSLVVHQDDKTLGRTPELPMVAVDAAPTQWRAGSDGIMLRSTASELRLPLPPQGPIMITGLADTQTEAVQQALITSGHDGRAARIYVPPEPAVAPAALLATAVALVVLVLATVLTAIRGQIRTLRGYMAGLTALGLPPAWTRRILLYQQAALIAVSTLLGLIIALLPTVIIANRISGFVLSVPWAQLATLLAAIYLAALLAATRSLLRLRAEREG